MLTPVIIQCIGNLFGVGQGQRSLANRQSVASRGKEDQEDQHSMKHKEVNEIMTPINEAGQFAVGLREPVRPP